MLSFLMPFSRCSEPTAKDSKSTIDLDGAVGESTTDRSSGSAPSESSSGSSVTASESDVACRTSNLRAVARSYAHTGFDADMVLKLAELLGIRDLVREEFCRIVLRSIWLLHRCGYTVDVTLWTLGYVALYGRATNKVKQALEAGDQRLGAMRCCMLMFLAHAYLVDEPCFLVTWHKYVFRSTCALEDLNRELMQLFEERSYTLAAPVHQVTDMYEILLDTLQNTHEGKRVASEIAQEVDGIPTCTK